MSSPTLSKDSGKGLMEFIEGSQEIKPLTCTLCTFITDNPEAFQQHQDAHGNMRLYQEVPSSVKQEPAGEWWPPYDTEEPSPLASEGSECLGPRGAYSWDLQPDGVKPLDRQWNFSGAVEEEGLADTRHNGQAKALGAFPSGGAGGEEPLLNYKVVVVGEEGGQGRKRRGACELQEALPTEEELTAQQQEHFSTVYQSYEGELEPDSEQAGLSGESSPGSRPPPSDTRASQSNKQKWQSKQYQCDLCSYVARGKQDLRIHEREEHLKEGSDVIKCSQCNYTTNKISFWRQHKLVHISANGTTGRIYMCKTCGWKTKYRHSLVKHIALHTGNKSFQCDQCGFACARKENLKRHKLTHLKKGVDGKGLMLKCNWCEYATAHSNALRRHAMTLHNADENYVPEYRCDVCEFKTTKLSNFSNHKITHLYGCAG
ncbi:RE1-silencing transcription factor-like [Carcharodon carcharias]|uniref:RE1-silencing transcription factor-like n=1 Tax=Carcharodon carcharias TaxID=13397 RepID=UPI001B7F4C30|nr:RE1-silencing transcription factor-like [Carcharodon carcharias]